MREAYAEDIAGVLPSEPTSALDGYRKLGFELAIETDVWEARLR